MMQRRKKLFKVLCLWLTTFGAIYINFRFFPDMQQKDVVNPIPPPPPFIVKPIPAAKPLPLPLITQTPENNSGIATTITSTASTTGTATADETSRYIKQDGKNTFDGVQANPTRL
jgi:hypothetical protein